MKRFFITLILSLMLCSNLYAQSAPQNAILIKNVSGASSGVVNLTTGYYFVYANGTTGQLSLAATTIIGGFSFYIFEFAAPSATTSSRLANKSFECRFSNCAFTYTTSTFDNMLLFKTTLPIKQNNFFVYASCPATATTLIGSVQDESMTYLLQPSMMPGNLGIALNGQSSNNAVFQGSNNVITNSIFAGAGGTSNSIYCGNGSASPQSVSFSLSPMTTVDK